MARRARSPLATLLLLGILIFLGWVAYRVLHRSAPVDTGDRTIPGPVTSGSRNLAMGNPSGATPNPAHADNYLLDRPQFAASYNRSKNEANWVSWRLVSADLGNVGRGDFYPDPDLPNGWYRVRPNDYTGSGYDRGHLCPSADRNSTPENNQAVFTMANIVPQTGDNNRGPWEKLESYCRTLAREDKELFIVAGGDGNLGTIGHGRIVIPAHTWKIVVVLPADTKDNDAARVDRNTRVIAVSIPNQEGIKETSWRQYRTSIAEIERATGYQFLTNVRPDVRRVLENKVDSR